jgi:replicative DNA helicase
MTTQAEITREQYLEKPLPSSADAERVVLSAILHDERVLPQAIEQLKPDHFYSPFHRQIYNAMLALFERSEQIDAVLIGEEIKKAASLDAWGGVAAISNISWGVPPFKDIRPYVEKVRKKAKVRELVKTCHEITSAALAEDDTEENVLSFAQGRINEVCTDDEKKGFVRAGVTSLERIHHVIELKKNGVEFTGLQTGFRDLDEKTGGLQKSAFIVIAGRPGMGKSSLAGNLAENVCALNPGAVVPIFSLEMSKEEYTDRLLCSMGRVDFTRYRSGYLTTEEIQRLIEQQAVLDSYEIHIDDTSSITPLEARSKLMRLQAERKRLDLVIVDFLQRMSSSVRRESRQQEVSHIAREMKSIAKDFKVPVIGISSLSRGPETRGDAKPRMSDLRESGDIESEADVVALVYREEYYKPNEINTGVAELILDKNRHGPTGTVKLAFLGEYTRFENYYGEYNGN